MFVVEIVIGTLLLKDQQRLSILSLHGRKLFHCLNLLRFQLQDILVGLILGEFELLFPLHRNNLLLHNALNLHNFLVIGIALN